MSSPEPAVPSDTLKIVLVGEKPDQSVFHLVELKLSVVFKNPPRLTKKDIKRHEKFRSAFE